MASNAEKQKCAERELKYRSRVYPRLVAGGKMSAPTMDYEIRVMEEIADDYRRLAEHDEPGLFR